MRHGPHQVAQKSTRTGTSEFRTSSLKLSSVSVTYLTSAAISIVRLNCDVVYGDVDMCRQWNERYEQAARRRVSRGCDATGKSVRGCRAYRVPLPESRSPLHPARNARSEERRVGHDGRYISACRHGWQ